MKILKVGNRVGSLDKYAIVQVGQRLKLAVKNPRSGQWRVVLVTVLEDRNNLLQELF